MEEVFALILLIMLLIIFAVFVLGLIVWWWEYFGREKFQIALKKVKNIRLNRKEHGLPMYERVARAYERKAENALHKARPDDAFLFMEKARKVREQGIAEMMEGKII